MAAKKKAKGGASSKEAPAKKKDLEKKASVHTPLADALAKRYSRPIIQRLSDETVMDIQRFSSGELGIDLALGGGWARGRIHKLQGVWGSGKSHLISSALAELTARYGEKVLVLDAEGAWTKQWVAVKGANVELVHIVRCQSAEMAYDVGEAAVESGDYSAIVIDSIAAMSPEAELDGSHEDWQQGLLARLTGKFVRKISARMNDKRTSGEDCPTVFIANQIRRSPDQYNPTFTPGGTQQDNHSTTILELTRTERIWDGPDAQKEAERNYVGNYSRIFVNRNKTAPPLKRTLMGILTEDFQGHKKYNFYHGDTFMRLGLKIQFIEQSGAWYTVPSLDKKFQGSAPLKEALVSDEDLRTGLVNAIKMYVPDVPVQFQPDLLMFKGKVEDESAAIS